MRMEVHANLRNGHSFAALYMQYDVSKLPNDDLIIYYLEGSTEWFGGWDEDVIQKLMEQVADKILKRYRTYDRAFLSSFRAREAMYELDTSDFIKAIKKKYGDNVRLKHTVSTHAEDPFMYCVWDMKKCR